MRKLNKAARKRWRRFGKRLPVYIASIATWACTGIWHGITPNFLLWGMMNCAVIVVSEELSPLYASFHGRFHLKEKRWYGAFEIARTFLIMNLIRIVDLFPNVGEYVRRLGTMFSSFCVPFANLGLSRTDYGILLCGCALMLCVSLVQEKRGSIRQLLWGHTAFRYSAFFLLFLAVLLMGRYAERTNRNRDRLEYGYLRCGTASECLRRGKGIEMVRANFGRKLLHFRS